MNLRYIRIFLSVCESGNNISEAARKMMISQPSVSVAIRELEEYYQVKLFDRISRRLYLTQAGAEFLRYAQRICVLFDDMEKEMGEWNTEGSIRIGASITIGSQFMAEYAARFRQEMPGIRTYVRVDHSRELEKQLLTNKLDLALVESPVHNEAVSVTLYMEDQLQVIAPPTAKFRENPVLTEEAFCAQPFLLREVGSGTREIFERVMREHDRAVEPVWEAASTTAILNGVSSGIGVSVIPRRMAIDAVESGKVVAVTVEGMEFRQKFYVVHHRDKVLTPYMKAFIEVVKQAAQECTFLQKEIT